jgi:hypothetical protein
VEIALPTEVRRLLWDTRPEAVNPLTQRAFILDRVLEYGNLTAIRWAEEVYGLAGIREYFLARGCRVLSAKTRCYWQAVLNLPATSCTPPSSTPPSNPLWPY